MKGVLVSVRDDRTARMRGLDRKLARLFCGTERGKAGTYGVDLRSRCLLFMQLIAQQIELLRGIRLEMASFLKCETGADRRTVGKGRRL
jgi:hypothetical protein